MRLAHSFLIAAFLATMGAHWAVLQSVAWATMLADNARVAPLSAALERTFDGKHPCALCKQVSAGRRSEKKAEAQSELKKDDFVHHRISLVLSRPESFILAARPEFKGRWLSLAPPVPPPRCRSV